VKCEDTSVERLPTNFYACSAEDLARRLLGCLLVRQLDNGDRLAVRIVETEAYVGVRDRASHAFGGRRTPRNEAMYADPGTSYVYFTYGMHHCFNVVCGRRDEPAAVLVRAAEPVLGVERMSVLRGAAGASGDAARAIARLCAGPARLCQALAIDRGLNAIDLTRDERLTIAAPDRGVVDDRDVVRTARIGLGCGGPWAARRLRWLVKTSPSLSVGPPRRAGRNR
jgi:DNA-3-methyladenine glycosylase